MDAPARSTTVCIVGGGPAGVMAGLLFARAGIEVTVLEKHADFFRDFRGDTIHPSTVQLMRELDLADEFLQQLQDRATTLRARIAGKEVTIADFRHIPSRNKFIGFMPQWDFLNFLAARAQQYPPFTLLTNTQCTDLLCDGERVTGVRAQTLDGPLDIHAQLVLGTDGRTSIVREKAGLDVINIGAPFDVLWMRISKSTADVNETFGIVDKGRFLVMIDRHEYFQCGFVIAKGALAKVHEGGIARFRDEIAELRPDLRDRLAHDLDSWEKVKLLEVRVDRLKTWYKPGVLCIGDAAHAMSPIGGVGINLAIQDAVATANILTAPLRDGTITTADLAAVQRRREFPTRVTQRLQVLIQENVLRPIVRGDTPQKLPLPIALLQRVPALQTIPAMAVGLGVRPEHVRTPNAFS